jgi:hypothetical protein
MRNLLLIFACVLVAGPARADATRDALAEIAKCADIAGAAERLKCFDDAMPRARSALAAPAPASTATPASAPPPRTATRSSLLDWFGFAQPEKPVTRTEDFGKPPPEPTAGEITEVTAGVVQFARTPRGKALFVLDNGQVWRQIDSDGTGVFDPAPGESMRVTIARGALGSYNLEIAGRNGLIKVNRLK